MSTFRRPSRTKNNSLGKGRGNLPLVYDAIPTVCDFTTPYVTCTFPVPVSLRGLPKWLTNTGKLPTVVTRLAPNVIKCTYDTPGSVTSITVPQRDPAIRTQTGGYAQAGSHLAA